jgi:hypothetical protein
MPRRPTGQVLEVDRKGGRTYALRFRAYGQRRYVTLGTAENGWTRAGAEQELANVLADIRRRIWKPEPSTSTKPPGLEPTFHVLAP